MTNTKIKTKYDYYDSLDLINLEFKQDYNYKNTIELEYGVNLDFDTENTPVNLEIDSASKYMDISKYYLINPKVKVEIITDKNIEIKIEFEFKNTSKKVLNFKTSPDL